MQRHLNQWHCHLYLFDVTVPPDIHLFKHALDDHKFFLIILNRVFVTHNPLFYFNFDLYNVQDFVLRAKYFDVIKAIQDNDVKYKYFIV